MGKPDVMGLAEVAARLGVGKTWARRLSERRSFPEPTVLAMGHVWSTEDIEAWIKEHRPPPAEPGQ